MKLTYLPQVFIFLENNMSACFRVKEGATILFNDSCNLLRLYCVGGRWMDEWMNEWMNMEKFWNDSGMGRVKYLEKNLFSAPLSAKNST